MTTCKPEGSTEAFLAALYGTDVGPEPAARPPAKLGYIIEPGVTAFSYSKRNNLHKCPRYFHLKEDRHLGSFQPNAHTAFGHAYGAGVQMFFRYAEELSLEEAEKRAVVATLAYWDTYSIWDADPKEIKTLWAAVIAVRKFCREEGIQLLTKYKLAYHPTSGKPLIELLYYIRIGEGYSDQGHIDLVLEDRVTGELLVVEMKTGSAEFAEADWANSAQTIGYNVVLQAFGAMSKQQVAYHVLYLCYNAKDLVLQQFHFSRSLAERAEWLASLMLDVQLVEMYKSSGVWPKRGTQCRQYKRNCEFFGTCDLTRLAPPKEATYTGLPIEAADFVTSVEELLEGMRNEAEHVGDDGGLDDFDSLL